MLILYKAVYIARIYYQLLVTSTNQHVYYNKMTKALANPLQGVFKFYNVWVVWQNQNSK